MNFLEKIKKNADTYSENELRMLSYMEKDLEIIANHNITALAQKLETSPAAVTRFVKKTEFENYQDFRMSCISYLSSGWNIDDNQDFINILTDGYYSLFQKMQTLPLEKDLEQLSELIKNNDTLYAMGGFRSNLAAKMLSYEFLAVEKHFISLDETLVAREGGNVILEDSVIVLFSVGLNSVTARHIISAAKTKNCKLVIVTMTENKELRDLAELYIVLPNAKGINSKLKLDNSVLQMIFVNGLMNYYTAKYYIGG